jgi:hypothetical protein
MKKMDHQNRQYGKVESLCTLLTNIELFMLLSCRFLLLTNIAGFSLRQRAQRKNQGGVGNKSITGDVLKSSNTEGIFSLEALPFVLEMAFMTFVACFVMHVQVQS